LLEGKLPRTRHHSLRVAATAVGAGRRLGMQARTLQDLASAALLHDIGKLGVAESVLLKSPHERTPDEEETFRSHPALGRRILEPIASLAGALPLILHHHERLDGSGYPDGLAGDDLGPAVELLAAANRLDVARIEQAASDRSQAAAMLREDAARGLFGLRTAEAVIEAAADI